MPRKQIAVRLPLEAIEALAELRAYLRVRNPDARMISEADTIAFALGRTAREARRSLSSDPRIIKAMAECLRQMNLMTRVEYDQGEKQDALDKAVDAAKSKGGS